MADPYTPFRQIIVLVPLVISTGASGALGWFHFDFSFVLSARPPDCRLRTGTLHVPNSLKHVRARNETGANMVFAARGLVTVDCRHLLSERVTRIEDARRQRVSDLVYQCQQPKTRVGGWIEHDAVSRRSRSRGLRASLTDVDFLGSVIPMALLFQVCSPMQASFQKYPSACFGVSDRLLNRQACHNKAIWIYAPSIPKQREW